MLRIVFGFATSERSEVPAVLYIGHDGDAAATAAEAAVHPRVEVTHLLQTRPLRRWSEEGAAAFAKTGAPVVSSADPTLLQDLDDAITANQSLQKRIEELEAQLAGKSASPAPLPNDQGGPASKKELEALDDAQLLDVARAYNLTIGEVLDRKTTIKSILAAAAAAATKPGQ